MNRIRLIGLLLFSLLSAAVVQANSEEEINVYVNDIWQAAKDGREDEVCRLIQPALDQEVAFKLMTTDEEGNKVNLPVDLPMGYAKTPFFNYILQNDLKKVQKCFAYNGQMRFIKMYPKLAQDIFCNKQCTIDGEFSDLEEVQILGDFAEGQGLFDLAMCIRTPPPECVRSYGRPVSSKDSDLFVFISKGSCKVTGDINAFKIECTKEIQNFCLLADGYFCSGKSITTNSLVITKIDSTHIQGTAPGQKNLNLVVNHTDGTKSNLSF